MAEINQHKRKTKSSLSSKSPKKIKTADIHEIKTTEIINEDNSIETSEDQNVTCLSLSIEETNKLRAKLGLAPLESENEALEKKDFIHAPPKNISDEKLTEKFKDKILLMKEKRELDKKFKKYKKLYDVDNPEIIDDVSAWVTRSRTLQSKDFTEPLLTKINNEDVSLTVEHDQREFGVGEEAILTLKDTDVLNEAEDKLVNINLVEQRKARENIKNRTKVSDYNPYDEYDEQTGQLQPAQLLSKYNQEIYGSNLPEFKIESSKTIVPANTQINEFLESVKHIIKESLNVKFKTEKDYLTSEEYSLKFKKIKKRKEKSRSTRKSTTDLELQSIENITETVKKEENHLVSDFLQHESIEEDVAAIELHEALERARQSKLKTIKHGQEFLDSIISKPPLNEDVDRTLNCGITLDMVSEFVRSHDTYPTQIKETQNIPINNNSVVSINDDEESYKIKDLKSSKTTFANVFEDEPIIVKGLGAALQLLSKKGYLDDDKPKKLNVETNIPKTEAIIDREKMRSIHKGITKRNDRSNPEDEYKFEIDVGYYDKHGILLEPKDAFREVSYKFHGKKPAKKKLIKHSDKIGDVKSDADVAKSLQIMVDKQKHNKTPYLVLTGSNMNIIAPSIDVKKKK